MLGRLEMFTSGRYGFTPAFFLHAGPDLVSVAIGDEQCCGHAQRQPL